jgi:hypothetical protein
MKRIALVLLVLSVPLLAACKPGGDGKEGSSRSTMLWGKNVTLNASGEPNAEITAEGDFIVAGKKLPVSDQQRSLLLAYHREVDGIAEAGIATGKEGVKLAGKAVGAAVRGIFSGNPDQIEREIETEARKVEAEAMKICERLPALYQAQQALATALPEFAPYAGMDMDDIAQCRSDAHAADTDRARPPSAKMNAAEEADAAAAGARSHEGPEQ